MPFQSERELEHKAIPYLKENNFLYSWQVPLHNRIVDLVALNPEGKLIGIEFKLKDWKRVLKQAIRSSNSFDYLYVCMPMGRYLERLKENAREFGIGVIIFEYETQIIKIELRAKKITKQWKPNIEFLKNYMLTWGIS